MVSKVLLPVLLSVALLASPSEAQGCRSECPNGSDIFEFFNNTIAFVFEDGVNLTCADLKDLAADPSTTAEDCDVYHFLAFHSCGCPGYEVSCPLCEDGSLIPEPHSYVTDGAACVEIAYSLKDELQTSPVCQGAQGTAGVYCGCDNPETSADACRLCDDGFLPDTTRQVLIDGEDISCGSVEFAASTGEVTCDEARAAVGDECCQGSSPCSSACPDGSSVPNIDAVAYKSVDGSEISCGALEASVTTTHSDPADCDFYQFLGASQCGCSGGSAPTCPLCEDGSPLPDPLFNVLEDQFCIDAQYEFRGVAADRMECTAIQGTAGVYCGCNNPTASAQVCRLCGEDVLLPQPALTVNIGNQEFGCGEIEYAATIGDITCDDARDDYYITCCVTNSPTMTPVAPTMAPTDNTSSGDSSYGRVKGLMHFAVVVVSLLLFA